MNEKAVINLTIREAYEPATKITDPEEARKYFLLLVGVCMTQSNVSRQEAEKIEKANLGYYAGYYNHETRTRVEKLFDCAHPIFGPISQHIPTPEEALEAGIRFAKMEKVER